MPNSPNVGKSAGTGTVGPEKGKAQPGVETNPPKEPEKPQGGSKEAGH